MNRFEFKAIRLRNRIALVTLAKQLGITHEQITAMEAGKIEIPERIINHMRSIAA